MVLLAGLNAVLGRYTGETDIVIGAPSTERSSVEAEALIGFFVNTLPLRTDVSGDPSFRTLLARVRDTMLDAFSHRDVPFEAIVERLQPERDLSRSPLVQVMCAMAHGAASGFALPQLSSSPLRFGDDDGTTKFDLTVYGFAAGGSLDVSVGFYADAYDRDLMERFSAHFRRLFEAAASQPDVPISQLDLLGPAERRWLVSGLNREATPYPGDRTIPEVFADVVARHATDVAVSERNRTMTYRKLDEAADALAARLRDAGVRPGDAVGLTAERSSGLVVAMLGALKAGACYVPLDPTYPSERLEYMAADARVRAIVRLTSGGFSIESVGEDEPFDTGATAPAYIMYTSGSTGRPKGVAIPHRAILRLVWDADYAGLGPDDVVAHASNTAFDAATWEVWGALLNGARLEVLDGDTLTSPGALAAELRARGVTAMFVTTALFNIISREVPDAFGSLDHLLFGGEAVDSDAVARIVRAAKPRRLVHVYGPTETTTFASWHEVTAVPGAGETVPIGLPIVNTTLHVLDEARLPVPVGVAGELYIGGDGLALGYVGDADLTRQKFVADPFMPGSRLYRTGDRVRRRRDGAIEFVGRIDRQVKLRGFRIEPGEVEAELRRFDEIAIAVVRVWRRNGDARLVGYVVPEEGATIEATELQERLRGRLPDHMVPAHLTVLDAMPLNPNGKIDTKQLPEPAEHHVASYVAPRGQAMVRMAELWRRALRVERVGANDSFFDLGGHSLLAVELMAAVEKSFGKAIPLSTLFDAPTLAAFTVRVSGHDDSAEADLIVPIQPNGSRLPLFCFHPGGGNVFYYRPLARHLDEEQPVLGIQARGADGRSRPHRTVEEMAAAYVAVIKQAQPEGPVHLLGWSLGGLIAFETARLLEQEGRIVALLALLDTSFPRPTSWWERQRSYFRTLRRDGLQGLQSVAESMWAHTRVTLGKLRHGPRWAYYLLRAKPIPPLLAGKRLTHIGLAANESYRPSAYPGVVTYLRATGPDGSWTRRPDLPWCDVAARVDVIDVPGAHAGPGSMLDEPHLAVLAGEVDALLQATAVEGARA
jgi:amino acid adenylation domain-containing protein